MSLTDEQKAIRRTGITATDAAAILGLSPFRSPLDVYRTKIGELDDVPAQIEGEGGELRETRDTERGRFLEPALVQWAGAKLARPVEHTPGLTVRCAYDPLILASPDGLVHTGDRPVKGAYPLEVKAPGGFHRLDEWGPDGADAEGNVPADYEVQLRIQMAALQEENGYLAALLGPELRVYHLRRDHALERQLIAKMHEWHERHIVAGVPPPPTLAERDQRWLKSRYPNDKLPPLAWESLSSDQQRVIKTMVAAYREMGTWRALYERLSTEAKQFIGDHAGVTIRQAGWDRVDWKSNKPGTNTDWEAFARDLHRRLALCVELARHIPHDRVPPELVDFVVEPDDLCRSFETEMAAFTKTTPGNRVFRPWPTPKGK